MNNKAINFESLAVCHSLGQTIPTSRGDISAYQDAIHIIYAKLRAANSGARNFGPEDVSRYIESVRSLLMATNYLGLIFTAINAPDLYVQGSPKHIYQAIQGSAFNDALYENVILNHANSLNRLNYIRRMISEVVPMIPGLSVLERDLFLTSNIFVDKQGKKAVPTIFAPNQLIGTNGEAG